MSLRSSCLPQTSFSQQFLRLLIGPIFSLPTAALRFLHAWRDSQLFCLQFAFPTENVIDEGNNYYYGLHADVWTHLPHSSPNAPHCLQTSLQFLFSPALFSPAPSPNRMFVSQRGSLEQNKHKADDQIAARWSCPVLPALWQIKRDLGPLFRYPLLNQHAAGQRATHKRSRSRRAGGVSSGPPLMFSNFKTSPKAFYAQLCGTRRKAMRLTKREMSHFLLRK